MAELQGLVYPLDDRDLGVRHHAVHRVLENGVEGVVGKWAQGRYCCDGETTSWLKIKNSDYSQAVGRHELFEGRARGTAKLNARTRLLLA